MALVCDHLGLNTNGKNLDMELVDVGTMTDALAWGYAGAIPSQVDWVYTSSVFGKFRTTALLKKAVEAAREAVEPFSSFRSQTTDGPSPQISHDSQGAHKDVRRRDLVELSAAETSTRFERCKRGRR